MTGNAYMSIGGNKALGVNGIFPFIIKPATFTFA